MPSQKQVEANRRNAQRSTGPRTLEGKSITRLNSVKHGLRTRIVEVLPNEDADAFEHTVTGWVRDLAPRTEAELAVVHQVAIISWKLNRAERHETAVLSRRVIDAINSCDCEDDDTEALHEAAAIASFDPSPEGERFRRYQFSLMRELRQTLDAYAKLRKQAFSPNEAILARATVETNEPIADPIAPSASEINDRHVHKQDSGPALPARQIERTHFEETEEREIILPDRQESDMSEPNAHATNEAISHSGVSLQTRQRRDRWPLETLKRKRRQAQIHAKAARRESRG